MKRRTHKKQKRGEKQNGGACGCGKVNIGLPTSGGFFGLFENSKNDSDEKQQRLINQQQMTMNQQMPVYQQQMPVYQQQMPMAQQQMPMAQQMPTYEDIPGQSVVDQVPQDVVNTPAEPVGGSAFEAPTLRRMNNSSVLRRSNQYNSRNINSLTSLLETAEKEGREAFEVKTRAKQAVERQKELIQEAEQRLDRNSNNYNSSSGLTLGGRRTKRRSQKKKKTQKKYKKIRQV